MKIFRGFEQIDPSQSDIGKKKTFLTIGNFDGVHLGHQEIISQVVERAKREDGISAVFTFRPHPHLALTSNPDLELLQTYDEKLGTLESLGVDVVIEQPFVRSFSETSPENFVKGVLIKRLGVHALYVGYDFGFGKDRAGSIEMLRNYCAEEDVELHEFKPTKIDGEISGSSRIRAYLKAGDVATAAKLMGRNFSYRGSVVHGKARGRTIGFPTANITPVAKLMVKAGVYATVIKVISGASSSSHLSVTNIGNQPTFNKDSAPIVIETHIFDFNADIYGREVEIELVGRIRDEIRFASVEDLKVQILKDAVSAKAMLAATGTSAK